MTETNSRIALVTGANRGLGRSEALALAADGTDLILTFRNHEDEARTVIAEIEALGRTAVAFRLDVGEPDGFDAFAATVRTTLRGTWGRDTFDVLVNNGGMAGWTPLGEISADNVRSLLDTHVLGVIMLTQALVPLVADGGRIVNTSTGLARFTGDMGYSTYAAAKGAVEVWTRYLAKELGPRRIAVNAIAPGATGTDIGGGSLRDDEQTRAQLSTLIAMGHVGVPEDIGSVVAALASERMGWVTGQRIEASGGMLL